MKLVFADVIVIKEAQFPTVDASQVRANAEEDSPVKFAINPVQLARSQLEDCWVGSVVLQLQFALIADSSLRSPTIKVEAAEVGVVSAFGNQWLIISLCTS